MTHVLNIRNLDDKTFRRFKAVAALKGMTMQEMLRQMIDQVVVDYTKPFKTIEGKEVSHEQEAV